MAAVLAEQGAEVVLVDHRPERAARISREGVRAVMDGREWTRHVPCVAEPGAVADAALILVLVKAYQTASVGESVARIPGAAPVLTLQNGLGNYQELARALPEARVLAGTIVMGCNATGEGQVTISGVGEIALGSPYGNAPAAQSAAAVLRRGWAQVRLTPDVDATLWHKVLINAAVNPLTALTGLHNGELLDGGHLQATLGATAREVAAVAAGLGMDLGDNPAAAVEGVCRLTAGNRTSMLQDLEQGRRTEVEAICGEVVRAGQAAGVLTPLCEAFTGLIGCAEKRAGR
jgi:2-dehydropantoate 2-reductase